MPTVTPADTSSTPAAGLALPALCWAKIIQFLDDRSCQQLKLASRRFRSLIRATGMEQLSVSDLRRHATSADEGGAAPPSTSCLCITEPRRPVALSVLNHRHRCEQQLAVFLDNLAPWPALTALDISTALSHISCSTLQLLVESLPQLHQLSLPPCAGTEAEVLSMLQQMPCLCACDLDCSFFNYSSCCNKSSLHGSNVQQQEQQLQQACAQHFNLEQMYTSNSHSDSAHANFSTGSSQLQKLASSSVVGAADGTCSGPTTTLAASGGPWSRLPYLAHMQHLQLHHLQASCMRDALHAVAKMTALRSLGVTGLCRTASSLVLAPLPRTSAGAPEAGQQATEAAAPDDEEGQWLLSCLQDLSELTRLEIGLDNTPTPAQGRVSSSSSSSAHVSPSGSLVVPAHTASAAGHSAAAVQCSWSQLHLLQELVLHNICLDSPLFAATLPCQQLTALRVGGLDLQQDVRTVTKFLPAEDVALRSLQELQVERHFSLGPHSAAVLLPALTSLKVTHTGSHCPDLSCLEHHQQLFSLDVAAAACAAGSSWALHSLQLGHLVHLEALRELRLAEGCCEEASTSPRGSSGNSCRGSPGMKGTGSYRSGCSKGSHWLPCCSGHPSQITSLELSGPVTDQSLGQLPGQFPGLKRLTVDSSYFASDGGLQRLNCAPHLELLILRDCRHITDYGLEVFMGSGASKVVAVQDCYGIDERACHRIRKACRTTGGQLLWYGCSGTSPAAAAAGLCSRRRSGGLLRSLQPSRTTHDFGSSSSNNGASSLGGCRLGHSTSPGTHSPAGSAFLHRCWKEEQPQCLGPAHGQHTPGPVSALVAAATAVWLDTCRQACPAPRLGSAVEPGRSSSSSKFSSRPGAGFVAVGSRAMAGLASGEARPRRVSGSCQAAVQGSSGEAVGWASAWVGGGRNSLAH